MSDNNTPEIFEAYEEIMPADGDSKLAYRFWSVRKVGGENIFRGHDEDLAKRIADGLNGNNFLKKQVSTLEHDRDSYHATLENGMQEICEALGIDSERYDDDKADIECYMDCFREAAELLKKSGFEWDNDAGEWTLVGSKS